MFAVNDTFVSGTGDAMRVILVDEVNDVLEFSICETNYVGQGKASSFQGLLDATESKPISELEYKLRTVAMRMFQDCKGDKDYPHKSAPEQYEELVAMPFSEEGTESFFKLGGGYKDYTSQEADEE